MRDDCDDDPWWRYGLCAQVGPELFFLRKGDNGNDGKSLCRRCEVRAKCLADSITTDIEHGIFGGFGREERRVMNAEVEAGASPHVIAARAIANDRKGS